MSANSRAAGRPPVVSVVMIFLNEERFLAEAIDSVLAQTFEDWELLLIDDGSTDASPEIARGYAARDARIRFVQHPGGENRGMSASRNLGLEHARGRYLAPTDGDDVWVPDKLAEQVAILDAHPSVAMAFAPLQLWYSWAPEPEEPDSLYGVEPGTVHPFANSLVRSPDMLLAFLRDLSLIPGGVLVRTDVLRSVGGAEESFRGSYEDAVVHVKLCLDHDVYVSDRLWYRYRIHPESHERKVARAGRENTMGSRFYSWVDEFLSTRVDVPSEVREVVRDARRELRIRELRRQIRRVRGRLRYEVKRTRSRAADVAGHVFGRTGILMYHRVDDVVLDPWELSVTPENFEAQLRRLTEVGCVVGLGELRGSSRLERLRAPRSRFVVTFDDGYVDNLEEALPALERVDVPATFFIATGFLNGDAYWWDVFDAIVLGESTPVDALLDAAIEIGLVERPETAPTRDALHALLYEEIAVEPLQAIRETLDRLVDAIGADLPVTDGRPMTTDELVRFAAHPLVTIGAHTVTHPRLAIQELDVIRRELTESRRTLTELTGTEPTLFAYPYGSYGPDAVTAAREVGFTHAVTTDERWMGPREDSYRLPRLAVPNVAGPALLGALRTSD